MLLCAFLVIAPLVVAVVAPLVGVIAAVTASPTVSAPTVEPAPVVDTWVGREVDRRGRILPRRDTRGRFIRSDVAN